ncbi:hypothetical protein [Mesorhizobium sp. M7A.F.Ca.MR.176.00.0.0]|uniref:hypothetical protein n=1 Tax=Mesorhizobium sp. M7A.F.Ca.MR.176.00.0.0 TaxID=2496776 RepID=UPI0013E3BA61|nr:hypothetical protein [Mesorhizobium sp. M7A.F.Ca.MR.176.00.0.0]
MSPIWTSLPGGIEQGTNTDRFVATYQRALGAGATPAQATQVAATVQAQQPVQVASLDPSAGATAATARPMPPAYSQNGMTQQQWDAMNRPGEDLAPSGAAPAPLLGEVGGPEAVTPAGQRVLGTMMDKTPLSGAGSVVQALSAVNQPAPAAAAAASPVVQALAGAQQPQRAAPVSPSVQKVAQALAPQQQAPEPQQQAADNLPVIAGGTADAIQPGQGGPSVQQIMQVAADPWASPEQKAMANMMLQQRMQEQDPLRQLQIQAARKSLAVPPKQWQKLDDRTLFDAASGETKQIGGSGGPTRFEGTGLDAQAWNILQSADPSSREYATAYAIVSQPKTQLVQTQAGMMPVEVPPVLPAWLSPPGGAAPAVPTPATPAPAAPLPTPAAPAAPAPQPGGVRSGQAIPGTAKPLNEAQQRDAKLYSVVAPELKIVEDNFGALSNLGDQALSAVPRGSDFGADYLKSPEYQRASNSLKTIIASYLYSVSGPTAAPAEVENQASILTPKPGEAKESVNDKLARVRAMVDAIRSSRGGGDAPAAEPTGAGTTSNGLKWSIEP